MLACWHAGKHPDTPHRAVVDCAGYQARRRSGVYGE
jgi:hypothetical protein